MTEQHRDFDAFDRQCEDLQKKWLRQHAKPAESNYPELPDSSLVERVEKAMWAGEVAPDARAAIREVAAWLREHSPDVHLFNAGLVLDRELQ